MKILLRTNGYSANRPTLKVLSGRRKNMLLRRVGRNYEIEVVAGTIEELNKEVGDAVLACSKAAISIVPIIEEMVEPKKEIPEWEAPALSELDEAGLRGLCDKLGISHNLRHAENGLRDMLGAYYLGQIDFFWTFKVEGKRPPPIPAEFIEAQKQAATEKREEIELQVNADAATQAPPSADNPLEMDTDGIVAYIDSFGEDGTALIESVYKHIGGKKLDARRSLPNHRKMALKSIKTKQAKIKPSQV